MEELDEHTIERLDALMSAMRTEWFVWEVNKPSPPRNVLQIKQICQKIITLLEEYE